MAEAEEDFSSLPLPDRFVHKNWKVRKEGYEDAAKEFASTPDESAAIFRPFLLDSGLWKGAVADSNVAAQQEGINALCAFLKYGGVDACRRSRSVAITPIVEKALASTKAGTKQNAIEALLLYIEIDKADPIIEDLLPGLSNKQPKVVAATLAVLVTIYHNYGTKIVDPKPVLKALPKVFGHADKNVRAEASNLAVELYRWLKDAMKTLFWNELKPLQQQELEKSFEPIKQEPSPKQERLLRSQQVEEAKPKAVAGADVEYDEDEPAEEEVIDLAEPQDVYGKIPPDFQENMASAKWKDRKDALDALFAVANVARIKDGPFDEVVAVLAKSMKDANVLVVTVAANCIEVLAKGLRKSFAKYRGRVMSPMLERLKEKKQAVADALGAALDAVFASTSLSDNLEDIFEFLKHKNPQVKLETLRFLIRCLRNTRIAPSKTETKSIADAAKVLLTESTEVTRAGGAEILGTLMKIMGERAMGQYLEGLDDIRKTKIKEYFDAAVVKAKDKPPKPIAPPKATAPQKKTAGKKPATTTKKAAPTARASTPQAEEPSILSPKAKPLASRSIPSKLGGAVPKSGLAGPSGLKGPSKIGGSGAGISSISSPKRNISNPDFDDEAPPAPKLGGRGLGLTGRPLGKPTTTPLEPLPPAQPAGMTSAERAEMDELRSENIRLQRLLEDSRSEKQKLLSQINELQNQNAQLIEDHTRDVLSIKAKETQLVRARSDAESAEQTVQKQQREMERLKRELSRAVRATSPAPLDVTIGSSTDQIYRDRTVNGSSTSSNHDRPSGLDRYNSGSMSSSREIGYQRARNYMNSPSEEKENGGLEGSTKFSTGRRSPPPSYHGPGSVVSEGESTSRGRGSPIGRDRERGGGYGRDRDRGGGESGTVDGGNGGAPIESWRRAAEVTSQLRARIDQMKVRKTLGSK
ncbi:MAG: Microtubule-associated protein, microtubule dynamics during spindle orientation [Icmadophila ericetorum]|nr:Microtubule-associated protein, microtubule dynamics during spindle orientation [Icmadophila ericetorum]